MLFKLSFKNIRKSIRDYAIYFVTLVLGVAVFYALPARSATTPLEVKLTAYQQDMEQTEARDIE